MGTGNALNISAPGLVAFDGTSVFFGRTLQQGTGITITNGNGVAGDPIISVTGGGVAVEHLTGNTGGQLNPDGSNNFNIITANSTVKFVGSGSTLTQDFSLTNLLLGSSGPSISTATANTSLGNLALNALTSGFANCAFGTSSLFHLTTGSTNVAIGRLSGTGITTGSSNILLGQTGINITTGNGNVALGDSSLPNLITGINNTVIGLSAGTAYTSSESSNILIQNAGVAGESNVMRMGTSGSGNSQINKTFIAGVTGVTVAASSPVAVASTGQQSDLGFGTATQVLTSNGAGVSPTWQATSIPSALGFFAYANATISNVTGASVTYTCKFNGFLRNDGGAYSTSTGLFTAPKTGLYHFSCTIGFNSATPINGTTLLVGSIGSAISQRLYQVSNVIASASTTFICPCSWEVQMTAGDTMGVQMFSDATTQSVNFLGGVNSSASFNINSSFSGYFVGGN